jgi:hypothetical protein
LSGHPRIFRRWVKNWLPDVMKFVDIDEFTTLIHVMLKESDRPMIWTVQWTSQWPKGHEEYEYLCPWTVYAFELTENHLFAKSRLMNDTNYCILFVKILKTSRILWILFVYLIVIFVCMVFVFWWFKRKCWFFRFYFC